MEGGTPKKLLMKERAWEMVGDVAVHLGISSLQGRRSGGGLMAGIFLSCFPVEEVDTLLSFRCWADHVTLLTKVM